MAYARIPPAAAAALREQIGDMRRKVGAVPVGEESHIDYLETQLGLAGRLGESLYLAHLIEQPGS